MVYLDEIMNRRELIRRLDAGYVRSQQHPTDSLTIFNYTNKTQFDNEWDDVTEQCRGLIINLYSEEVVSRPFRKFHNWEQMPPVVQADLLKQKAVPLIKWDGSLGILYRLHTGEYAIATRGSFTSPQAKHATELLRECYAEFEPIMGLTYLFEIVFPENRIVVDYKDMDDLVLLAVIDTETGGTLPPGPYDWPGPWNEPLTQFETLADVLAAPQRENEEGFVVWFPKSDMRVKWKFDEYKRLHRILTNTSSLSVWEALSSGQSLDAIIEHVPDEFYHWVKGIVHGLRHAFADIETDARDEYDWIMKRVRRPEEDVTKRRKEFALLACESPYKDVLFGLYDGKDIAPRIWKRIRPQYEVPWTVQPEETA